MEKRQSFYNFFKIARQCCEHQRLHSAPWLGQRQGQNQVDAEWIKKMPGIQGPTLSWASGLPFQFSRVEKSTYVCENLCISTVSGKWLRPLLIWSLIFNFSIWKEEKQIEKNYHGASFYFVFSLFFKNLYWTRGQNWFGLKSTGMAEKVSIEGSRDGCPPDFVHTVVHKPLVQIPAQVWLCRETFPDSLTPKWSSESYHLPLTMPICH